MGTRRKFLGGLTAGTAHALFRRDAIARSIGAGRDAKGEPAGELAGNEDYWSQIQRCFDTDRTLINLNNGGVSPAPSHVLEQMIRDLRFCNELPVHHMWQVLEPRIETVRGALARQFGCDPEELAITRNASEAMETLILGIDLKRGDEVIVTDQNYPRMLNTWDQRARRDGIVVKRVSFPDPARLSRSVHRPRDRCDHAQDPRHRVPPHHQSQRADPARCATWCGSARERGIAVFVDGAHSFAHFPFTRDELDCDFFGTSLHKWLLAPIGTGFLYVRKARHQVDLAAHGRAREHGSEYPQVRGNRHSPGGQPQRDRRRSDLSPKHRRRAQGGAAAVSPRPVGQAAPSRPAAGSPSGLHSTTTGRPAGSAWSSIEGIDPAKLSDHLFAHHKIVTVAINHKDFSGIRVTPNVYTTPREIDVFTEAMRQVVAKGIS